jgi:cytochrome c oxidase subunit 2/cytochrome aa3-600 menaquinol oxidase subunit 2
MLAGSAAIFVLVMALLALAFRHGGSEGEGTRLWIHGFGLAFPLAVLAALLGWGLFLGERHLVPGRARVVVEAEARQWAWTFRYPDPGRAPTEGVLVIPAGQPVDVAITSRDVIHSFWVPRLAGKLDAIPGRVNVLAIEAELPGDYGGLSAEFSGAGYAGHRFTVRAVAPADWDAFLAGAAP